MWQVILTRPPYSTLTYGVPDFIPDDHLFPGQRVLIPLGRSRCMGVLKDRLDQRPADLPEKVRLRDILWPLDREPILDAGYMAFVFDLAARQAAYPGRILENVLPSGLRMDRVAFKILQNGRARRADARTLAGMAANDRAALWPLWLDGRMSLRPTTAAARDQEYCTLAKDPPWAVRPGAKRQLEILELLLEHGSMPRTMLLRQLPSSSTQALNVLVSRGIVRVGPPQVFDPASSAFGKEVDGQEAECPSLDAMTPTPEQAVALADLEQAMETGGSAPRLVFGVTGCGKTHIYLRLAAKALSKGRSVLILAPEVALACSLARQAAAAFPERETTLYHGYLPLARKEDIFRQAATPGPHLVVGTRSALFLPLKDVGLTVLDEEHDGSFKQDEGLAYQAKEVAWSRAKAWKSLLVLGSATPDVKTFHAARGGSIAPLVLKDRVGDSVLPHVELADMRGLEGDGPLAPDSTRALAETVEGGRQAIIMLNRRGYAPIMYCRGCEAVAKCPDCDIGLTYHKGRQRLVCHYCGRAEPFPMICPKCGGSEFTPLGSGTEQLQEILASKLPSGTEILRLDRDSTRRPGRMEEILDAFAAQKAQVLVGTQMLSKGHHFPNVTLVVAADADLGLNLPDYRAAERTFQLLVQVSGRSGRGDHPGRVIIQTRDPNHYCWDFVRKNDYQGFFDRELALREKYNYPPFSKLGLVRLSFPLDHETGRSEIMSLVLALGKKGSELGVRVLGPAPSPLSLLRGRKRFQCLLKASDWPSIRTLYGHVRQLLGKNSAIRTSLDLDPVNML